MELIRSSYPTKSRLTAGDEGVVRLLSLLEGGSRFVVINVSFSMRMVREY